MKINIKAPQIITNFKTERIYPELEDITITPKTEEQIFESEKYGFRKVIVTAVDETIGSEELEKRIKELENENTILKREIEPLLDFVESETGNPVNITDSTDLGCEIYLFGNVEQDGEISIDTPAEIIAVGMNGSVKIKVDNGLDSEEENYQSYAKTLPVQKEFVKIGDNADCFIKQDGRWYEKHFPKVILTGKENVSPNAADTGTLRVTLILSDSIENTNESETIDVISNYFKGVSAKTATTMFPIDSMSIISRQRLYIVVDGERFDNYAQNVKTWLTEKYVSGNPVVIYYISTEPELIACTEEQTEILNSFTTYRNKTNVSVDGIGTLKVLYKQER